MELAVNCLIFWATKKPAPVDRLLWMDPEATDYVLIRICDDHSEPKTLATPWPYFCDREHLKAALSQGEARVLAADIWTALGDSVESHHIAVRDRAWEIIGPIMSPPRPELFSQPHRLKLVTQQMKLHKLKASNSIHRWMKKYWQLGQVPNALLPQWRYCGAPGEDRLSTAATPERTVGDGDTDKMIRKKRGRPRLVFEGEGREIVWTQDGVNVTKNDVQLFNLGIKAFYNTKEAKTLKEAFRLTLGRFYSLGYEENGNPILPPANELPTLTQFVYWHKKGPGKDLTNTLTSRKGKRKFLLEHRALLDTSNNHVEGPGSTFQIDSTRADIYLVHPVNRNWIVGRPILYLCIDVFSRLIVGFAVTFEEPSYLAAMLAIENVATDKVEYCKRLGIRITADEWPSHHLCEKLYADGGELKGPKANPLLNSLGIHRLDIAPPYRADLKAIVERGLKIGNDQLLRWLPGYVPRMRERGERDCRLDARFDVHRFRKIVALWVLHHNRQILSSYDRDVFMIARDVVARPINLWKWGVENRTGHLISRPQDAVRLAILPRDEARVTQEGLTFRGVHFTCETAAKEQWFEKAGSQGTRKISIAYDPRDVEATFFCPSNDVAHMEPCSLLPRAKRFEGLSWFEVDWIFSHERHTLRKEKASQLSSEVAFSTMIQNESRAALEEKKHYQAAFGKPHTKKEVTAGIRANQRKAKAEEQKSDSWKLGTKTGDQSVASLPAPPNDPIGNASPTASKGYIAPPSNLALFKKAAKKENAL